MDQIKSSNFQFLPHRCLSRSNYSALSQEPTGRPTFRPPWATNGSPRLLSSTRLASARSSESPAALSPRDTPTLMMMSTQAIVGVAIRVTAKAAPTLIQTDAPKVAVATTKEDKTPTAVAVALPGTNRTTIATRTARTSRTPPSTTATRTS